MDIHITIRDRKDATLRTFQGTDLVEFDLRNAPYHEGDKIVVETDRPGALLEVKLDASLSPSIVYLSGTSLVYPIPFEKERRAYADFAFSGNRIWGFVRTVSPRELSNYRNLALNAHDLTDAAGVYPHATTNTGATDHRYLARNAIDGIFQNHSHAEWPYGSWGINGREDARLRVDFGRPVRAFEVVLFARADFPHDGWWDRATLTLSDGEQRELSLEQTAQPQTFSLGEKGHVVSWVELGSLHNASESPWPALTQIMVLGTDVV